MLAVPVLIRVPPPPPPLEARDPEDMREVPPPRDPPPPPAAAPPPWAAEFEETLWAPPVASGAAAAPPTLAVCVVEARLVADFDVERIDGNEGVCRLLALNSRPRLDRLDRICGAIKETYFSAAVMPVRRMVLLSVPGATV
jgi:hypothetical protein